MKANHFSNQSRLSGNPEGFSIANHQGVKHLPSGLRISGFCFLETHCLPTASPETFRETRQRIALFEKGRILNFSTDL